MANWLLSVLTVVLALGSIGCFASSAFSVSTSRNYGASALYALMGLGAAALAANTLYLAIEFGR